MPSKPTSPLHLGMPVWPTQAGPAHPSVADWMEEEDQYWRWQYVHEPYYVPGRSYAQYRPAYVLGMQAAARGAAQATFAEVAWELEQAWEQGAERSLLPWSEVRQAVEAAWVRGRQHAQRHRVHTTTSGTANAHTAQIVAACKRLADDVQRMQAIPMNDFAQQVLARHAHMLRTFAKTLLLHGVGDGMQGAAWRQLLEQWRARLLQLKATCLDWEPVQLFEICALREEALLALYQRVLRTDLPLHLQALLKHQAHQLQRNREKLVWVKNNWTL